MESANAAPGALVVGADKEKLIALAENNRCARLGLGALLGLEQPWAGAPEQKGNAPGTATGWDEKGCSSKGS